jgi:hypothetical protein
MHEHRARESEEQKDSGWGDGKGRSGEEKQEALGNGTHGDPCGNGKVLADGLE